MSKNIILSYNNNEIEVPIPKDFDELKQIFIENFNEESINNFDISYKNSENKTISIEDFSDYVDAFENLKEIRYPVIYIEKKVKEKKKSVEDAVSENCEENEEGENERFELDPFKSGHNFSKSKKEEQKPDKIMNKIEEEEDEVKIVRKKSIKNNNILEENKDENSVEKRDLSSDDDNCTPIDDDSIPSNFT